MTADVAPESPREPNVQKAPANKPEIDWAVRMRTAPEIAIPDGLPGRWWAAHTKPRGEKSLATSLTALGITHFLPLHRRTTRSRNTGRVSQSISPVFTGYLFFNATEDQRTRALTTNRIATTLEVVDQRRLVHELRQIQGVLSTDTEFTWGTRLEVGDWVRVIAGPLVGVEGVIRGRRSRTRLALNVRMLAQSVQVEIERDLLERIDPPAFATDH